MNHSLSESLLKLSMPLVKARVCGVNLTFLVDTGSTHNVVASFVYEQIRNAFMITGESNKVMGVDGKYQEHGEEYVGKVLSVGENHFEIDMSGAYEKGDHFVKVRYDLKENGVLVKYTFSGIKDEIVFRFVSEYAPKKNDKYTC